MMEVEPQPNDERPSLLIVDDDPVFGLVLARALDARGFVVRVAQTAEAAYATMDDDPPEYAVVDLKLPDASGLKIVSRLIAADPQTRIVVLTGHASVPTAVEAIKLGARYYLPKPADADAIVAALHRDSGDDSVPVSAPPLTVERLEWDHIQRVLQDHDGNISATARALSMHRRTLQRKLQKHPAKG
jgi:two-component system, response regulator RegA